jgi:ribulose-phosphate 3-epimerase
MRIAPSILSADFARLGDQVARAEQGGADYIHVDVMDGHFVPNLTIGPLVIEAIRHSCSIPLDVHLMIEHPEKYLEDFIAAGASILTVHQEACTHLQATLATIRSHGVRAGVSICPSTPLAMIEECLEDIDLLLIMTVNPGFGGQKLIPATVGKVARARALLDQSGCPAELEVDGGVNAETAPVLVEAGARVLVAGSAVFGDDAIEANIGRLRDAAAPDIRR